MALTPDIDLITIVWRGVYRDNSPATGDIELKYNGGVELDVANGDNKTVAIFPKVITNPILPATITVKNKNGDDVSVTVGQAIFQVPASNDPDITGSGGNYTLTEVLDNGEGRVYTFPVDKDTPGGTLYAHEIAPSSPQSGVTYSGITATVFNALESRVQGLEQQAPGTVAGTVTSVNSVNPVSGNVTLTKSSIGLGNVDNTADTAKPVSTATQTALDGKADLVGGKVPSGQLPALSATDTWPIASQAAMLALSSATVGDFAVRTDNNTLYVLTALPASTLGNWILVTNPSSVSSVAGKTGAVSLVKADVGLGSVDNTADTAKPISTATQTALNAKENSLTAGTSSQYYRGDKTWQTLSKSTIGLANVDNTSDVDKPLSTAQTDAINTVTSALSGKASVFYRYYNGTSWTARPTGLPAGLPVVAYSTGYPAAPAPTGASNGDIWERDPDYTP